jgi:hypothetical protein
MADDVLSPYPSPARRNTELAYLTGLLGGEQVTYGHSVEGRPLVAAHIPSTQPSERSVLVCANIHGVEFIGNRVATGFLRLLPQLGLLERASVWVAPCLNPDGYARTWAEGGDAPLGALRCNARGVDLNRNFPLPWSARPTKMPFAGQSAPGAATDRGLAPSSEPEVSHLIALLERIRPHVGVNLHSFMGTLIQPRVRHLEDHRRYGQLTRALRAGQGPAARRYVRLAFPPLDVFTGEQEDYQHHVLRCWAACVESFTLSASARQRRATPTVFWRFNPIDPAPWVAQDVRGVAALLRTGLDLPRPPDRPGADEIRLTW